MTWILRYVPSQSMAEAIGLRHRFLRTVPFDTWRDAVDAALDRVALGSAAEKPTVYAGEPCGCRREAVYMGAICVHGEVSDAGRRCDGGRDHDGYCPECGAY